MQNIEMISEKRHKMLTGSAAGCPVNVKGVNCKQRPQLVTGERYPFSIWSERRKMTLAGIADNEPELTLSQPQRSGRRRGLGQAHRLLPPGRQWRWRDPAKRP